MLVGLTFQNTDELANGDAITAKAQAAQEPVEP
jgi:hypothetical protein